MRELSHEVHFQPGLQLYIMHEAALRDVRSILLELQPAWVNVALTAVNSNQVARSIKVSLDARLRVYEQRGFYAPSGGAALNFACSGHPLGVNVDVHCFGSYSSRSSNLWNPITLDS
jgi:hypothetical protein